MDKMPPEHAKELQPLVVELQRLSEVGIMVVAITAFHDEDGKVGNTIVTNLLPAQAVELLTEALENVARPARPWSDMGQQEH